MSKASVSTGRKQPVIDLHVHVLEPSVYEKCRDHTVFTGFGKIGAPVQGRGSTFRELTDPGVQIAHMDAKGIDVAVLSSSTVIQGSAWADPKTDLELCKRVNDQVASWMAKYPMRFAGSFVLPLQDLDASFTEIDRCVKLGMRMIQVPTNVDGVYMGDARFFPLWHAIDRLGLVAFVHPDGIRDMWFQKFRTWNSIGQAIEETKLMTSMIYEGVLERLPSLKVVMAHGGGFLPHYMARLDRNVDNMPESMVNITKRPSEYLRHFHFDTCLYDPTLLDALILRAGADRVVLGSDYPVGELNPVDFVRQARNLSDDQINAICGATAASLLGLELNGANRA